MPAFWHALYPAAQFVSIISVAIGVPYPVRSLLALFVPTGVTKVVKVYRFFHWNNQTEGGLSAQPTLEVRRVTSLVGGNTVSVRPSSTRLNPSALTGVQVVNHGLTRSSGTFRRYRVTSRTQSQAAEWSNLQAFIQVAEVWTAGDDAPGTVQPLTAREGTGIELAFVGVDVGTWSNVAGHDLEAQFTIEAAS